MLFQIIIQNMEKGSNVESGIDRSPLMWVIIWYQSPIFGALKCLKCKSELKIQLLIKVNDLTV